MKTMDRAEQPDSPRQRKEETPQEVAGIDDDLLLEDPSSRELSLHHYNDDSQQQQPQHQQQAADVELYGDINAQLLNDGNWVIPQEYQNDIWNQSMKLGMVYDDARRNNMALAERVAGNLLREDEEELRREEHEHADKEQAKELRSAPSSTESSLEPHEGADEDEEDEEAEAEADERAIDEVIGLDEEFAGDDAPTGISRMHETTAKTQAPRPYSLKKSYRIMTWPHFRLAVRLSLAIAFCLAAILVNPTEAWSGVPAWRWFAFASVLAFSWDICRLLIVGLLLLILSKYWYSSPILKNAHYYLMSVHLHVTLFLASIAWIVAWWSLIGLSRPNTETWNVVYDYISRLFGALIVWFFLLTVAGVSKEVAESLFERTTHWNDVERMLKCEYFLWRLVSQGTLFPHDAVAAFVLTGWRVTKADPKVLRQCTKYISKHPITAYDASGEPVQIHDMEEAADIGLLLFSRIVDIPEKDFAEEIRQLRFDREEQKKKTTKAYGYMLPGRSRLSLGSLNAQQMAAAGTQATSSNSSASTGSTIWMKPQLEEISPALKVLRDKRKIKFEDVEKAYIPYGALPQYAPDALYGWTQFLDVAHRGRGSARSLRAALIRFYQDRANVAATLRDAHAAVERLGIVFSVVANVLALVIAALIFAGSSSYEVWLGLTSFFVAMAVIFGSMLAQVFENIVFLFFRHEFDVGDLIVIDNDYYSVRRLELLSTLLLKWSGQYVLVENSWLAKQQVQNLTRSGLYWEEIGAAVDIGTCTPEFIHAVRGTVKQCIEKHPDSFSGQFQVCMSGMERPLHVNLSLWIEFAYRPNNLERLFTDIGRAHEAFCTALRTHGATSSGVPPATIHIGKASTPTFISSAGELGLAKYFQQLVTSGAIAPGPASAAANGGGVKMPPSQVVNGINLSPPVGLPRSTSQAPSTIPGVAIAQGRTLSPNIAVTNAGTGTSPSLQQVTVSVPISGSLQLPPSASQGPLQQVGILLPTGTLGNSSSIRSSLVPEHQGGGVAAAASRPEVAASSSSASIQQVASSLVTKNADEPKREGPQQ